MKWNYTSTTKSSNGYEDVMDKLKSYKSFKCTNLSKEEQERIIEEVFNIYRTKNIFPITYYNEEGIIEEIKKCCEKEVFFDKVLDLKFNQGQSLCRFFFPNMACVECAGDKRTPYNKFYDDHNLKRAIEFCLKHKTSNSPCVPSAIKDGLEMLGGGVATNFKTMKAKAIYERYCPPNGIIYDFSCGFGGRLLGALSSKNNYRYFGCEPCVETYTHLNELGFYIEKATNTQNRFKIICTGSENYRTHKNYVDFAFSSPPYFNLEKYSDEDTQCYNKFRTLDEWFNGYVEPTIQNIYHMLKPDKYYAVNIADFNIGKNTVSFVDKWIELSLNVGFNFVEEIPMSLQTRRGEGHGSNTTKKLEGVYVFRK